MTVPVLPTLDPFLIFPFYLLPSPVHPTDPNNNNQLVGNIADYIALAKRGDHKEGEAVAGDQRKGIQRGIPTPGA